MIYKKTTSLISYILLPLLFVLINKTTASTNSLDSLQRLVSNAKIDTSKVNLMNTIASQLENKGEYDQAIAQYQISLELAKKLKTITHQVHIESQIAFIKIKQGKYDEAELILKPALQLALDRDYKRGVAQCLRFTALIYVYRGEYEKATGYYLKALKVWETMKSPKGLALGYADLGIVHYYRNDFVKTANYWEQALALDMVHTKKSLPSDYNNLGLVYIELKEYKKAKEYFKNALELNKKENKFDVISDNYNNLGKLEYSMGNMDKAIEYMKQANSLREKIGNPDEIASGYTNIGEIYRQKKDYKNAIANLMKSLDILKKSDNKKLLNTAYTTLSSIYGDMNAFEKAYEYKTLAYNLKDTLLNEENSKQMNELEKLYDTEKKDNEIKLLNKDKALQDVEIQNQQTQRNAFIIGFALALILVVFIFRGFKQKQKANQLLEEKNSTIEIQKKMVEEKNKEIVDSINYAQLIQQAVLPSPNDLKSHLKDGFVLFKPKDIVSGDFYWVSSVDNYIFFSTVDCTGHGVPGGFMSMLGSSLLNEVINEKKIIEPADVLDMMRIKLITSLKQKGSSGENKDGMDMTLCRLNESRTELVYAAANNPLWLIRDGKLIEYPADKQPVGISTENAKQFSQQKIALQKGDSIYIFTDGYADQFGGPKGKKFKYKPLQELLLSNNNKTMNEQKEILLSTIENWKGKLEQVDDILIVGIRI